jgi:hypothetical protein
VKLIRISRDVWIDVHAVRIIEARHAKWTRIHCGGTAWIDIRASLEETVENIRKANNYPEETDGQTGTR